MMGLCRFQKNVFDTQFCETFYFSVTPELFLVAGDPREDSRTQDAKEHPITKDPKENPMAEDPITDYPKEDPIIRKKSWQIRKTSYTG